MSRLGKKEITIPAKTEVTLDGDVVLVKGPQGELSKQLHKEVKVTIGDGTVKVDPTSDSGLARALWGTFASHIQNMINGVNEPYIKKLEIEGVGYRAAVQGNDLVLTVGFSHPVKMPIPDGISMTVEKSLMTVKGINKEQVGQFAANIRAVKKPEPYKGKGIHYVGEYIIRKQGKKAA